MENDQKKVLIIDDEVRIGRVLSRILSREHDVTVCNTAPDGAEALTNGGWDLVICDLRMPDISGMELYDAAVEDAPDLSGKFLFLSGDLSGSEIRSFFDRTGEAELGKPFELADLRAKVADLLG